MENLDQITSEHEVKYTSFSFETDDAGALLTPSGTLVVQALGFPYDLDGYTCIPNSSVAVWSRTGVRHFDFQWYRPRDEVTLEELPESSDYSNYIDHKQTLCHDRRPDEDYYPITQLSVGGNYIHRVAFKGRALIFERLGHRIEIDLKTVSEDQRFTLRAEWSPQHMELSATWLEGEGLDEIYPGDGVDQEVIINPEHPFYKLDPRDHGELKGIVKSTTFEDRFPPESIVRAVRDNLGPTQPTEDTRVRALRSTYSDAKDFLRTVLRVIDHIRNTLETIRPTAFWNGDQPKSEPQAGHALAGYLRSVLQLKNISLDQQKQCRSGDLDFWLTGVNQQGSRFELALELKNAHAQSIEDGLTKQLPTYVQELDSDFGVYAVLWYKGSKFDEPKTVSKSQLLSKLNGVKPSSVDAVRCFDVAYRTPASML